MPLKMERCAAVCKRVGKSKTWVYNEIRQGRFPKPVQIGAHSVLWYSHEIDQYLEALPRSTRIGMRAADWAPDQPSAAA